MGLDVGALTALAEVLLGCLARMGRCRTVLELGESGSGLSFTLSSCCTSEAPGGR